ncbi:MAG TPA: NAD(P)/FAD-dependent oxidoreductase [Tepidisphaeraceae bacterium]|jgi:flavin-dependent dehydrogenase
MSSFENILAEQRPWDALIVGAGPAGSVSAALLAEAGWRVLLVEKSAWPREKVCGGCLNAGAIALLKSHGLAAAMNRSQSIERAIWRCGSQNIEVRVPGVAMCRMQFDAALVQSAIERGCAFLPATGTHLLPRLDSNYRTVELTHAGVTCSIRTKIVLACDGISGTLLKNEPWTKWHVGRNAWIGVAATQVMEHDFVSEAIHMHIGSGGYVGIVNLPDGRIHLAAALDPRACRQNHTAAALIQDILKSCRVNWTDLADTHLQGTPTLTRQRTCVANDRVLVVGDACGYIEPFTGEGMAWAIRGAIAVADMLIAADGWADDMPLRWEQVYRSQIQRRQRWCRMLRPLVHYPAVARCGIAAASWLPQIGNFLAGRINESNAIASAHLSRASG